MIQLRNVLPDDLPALSQLGIASKNIWRYSEAEMAIFSDELTLSPETMAGWLAAKTAYRDERLLGYYTLRSHKEKGVVELEHLFVDHRSLRQGIGTRLLEAARANAAENGFEKLTILADPNSVDFYKRCGAIKVGEHASSIVGRFIPILELSSRG